jgi:hypothetical protein
VRNGKEIFIINNYFMQRREILFCNLTILKNNKEEVLESVVYKDVDGHYKKNKVLKVEVISSLGYENEPIETNNQKQFD